MTVVKEAFTNTPTCIAKIMRIKVAIVEDDEGTRASLVALLRRNSTLRLAGNYANAKTALKKTPLNLPDVVLMDIKLHGMNVVEYARQLKTTVPAVQVLMLTVYEGNNSLFNSTKAGASGYTLKRTAPARLP